MHMPGSPEAEVVAEARAEAEAQAELQEAEAQAAEGAGAATAWLMLRQLMRCAEPYCHPSNSGGWGQALGYLLQVFTCTHYGTCYACYSCYSCYACYACCARPACCRGSRNSSRGVCWSKRATRRMVVRISAPRMLARWCGFT